jgi:hypothetical protein
MTCAPRGIFSTKSLSVGRTIVYLAPPAALTTAPSSRPIISACGMGPRWVWNSPPSDSVMR